MYLDIDRMKHRAQGSFDLKPQSKQISARYMP